MKRARRGTIGSGDDMARAGGTAATQDATILRYDRSTTVTAEQVIGPADLIILGTARDDRDPTGHSYVFALNDADIVAGGKRMIVDASALAADPDGTGPLRTEYLSVDTRAVTSYSTKVIGGNGQNWLVSGERGDRLLGGSGDDNIESGGGNDVIRGGGGDDYVIVGGSLTARDQIHGGSGRDTLGLGGDSLDDTAFAQVRGIETLQLEGTDRLFHLGGTVADAGVDSVILGVTSIGTTSIVVDADFGRALDFNIQQFYVGAPVLIDASASDRTMTFHEPSDNFYGVLKGGSGAEDTLTVRANTQNSTGVILTEMTGVEHIVVSGRGAAILYLDTAGKEIAAPSQTIDASALAGDSDLFVYAEPGSATSPEGASASLHVTGGLGQDLVETGTGDDVIQGGGSGDYLAGGPGSDVFTYAAIADSDGTTIDTIGVYGSGRADFTSGVDRIDVRAIGASTPFLHDQAIAFFGNQRSDGTAAAEAFGATAANHQLDAVYRQDTHILWFDTDDDGVLEASDLHLVLTGIRHLEGADIMAGALVG